MAQIKTRAQEMRTVYVSDSWEEYGLVEDRRKAAFRQLRWEDQTIYSDDLGRIKIVQKQGAFNASGSKSTDDPEENVYIYDGEKTVETSYSRIRDRDGRPLMSSGSSKTTEKSDAGYRTAYIHDGLFPAPRGPKMLRNPLTYMDEMFLNTLGKALEQNSTVKLVQNSNKSLTLTFSFNTNEPARVTYSATLDPLHNWVVTGINCTNERGRVLSEALCQYQMARKNLWVPKDGFYRSYDTTDQDATRQIPKLEWRYKVREIKVDDPTFPADAFDVVLKSDTLVTDARYHVTYRIGAEDAFDAKLKELAQAALASQSLDRFPAYSGSPRNSLVRRIIIIVNILALILVVTVMIIKYKKRIHTNSGRENTSHS